MNELQKKKKRNAGQFLFYFNRHLKINANYFTFSSSWIHNTVLLTNKAYRKIANSIIDNT